MKKIFFFVNCFTISTFIIKSAFVLLEKFILSFHLQASQSNQKQIQSLSQFLATFTLI